MTPKDFAALLDGATYDNFIRSDEHMRGKNAEALAKQYGLVVVFGASDDLMEFRGAIHDEKGVYEGGTAFVDAKGLLSDRDNIEDDDELRDYFVRHPNAKPIHAEWCAHPFYSWTFQTDIPHETFEITEGGEPYCRGIVFALADIKAKEPT